MPYQLMQPARNAVICHREESKGKHPYRPSYALPFTVALSPVPG